MYARLRDGTGRAVFTTRDVLEVRRGWFRENYPSVLSFGGKLYEDTGTYDKDPGYEYFRLYRPVQVLGEDY